MIPINLPLSILVTAGGIFDKANGLISNANSTLKAFVSLLAVVLLIFYVGSKKTLSALVIGSIIAALVIWLVPFNGINTIAGWLNSDLNALGTVPGLAV